MSTSFDDNKVRAAGDLAIALARPRPAGWHGALVARYANAHYAVALRPIGIAVRFGGAVVGLSGGGAVLTGPSGAPFSLRFGGDRRYWPHARAGVGPVVSAGYECAFASVCGGVVLAGVELYGAD